MKLSGNHAPSNESDTMSNYTECMCVILKLLADFGKEVSFGLFKPVLLRAAVPFSACCQLANLATC